MKTENAKASFTICQQCKGLSKKSRRFRKKVRIRNQKELEEFEKNKEEGSVPIRSKRNLSSCLNCSGSGLIPSANYPIPDKENYPNIAIIGAGIGGVALAVACLHRGIPFTLFERDKSFDARSQGYGLTLQQANRAIKGFGLFSLEDGIISTRHLVHTTDGAIIGEWGMRKWMKPDEVAPPKRTNIHIPRQALRLALMEQLGDNNSVQWGHQFLNFKTSDDNVELSFRVNGEIKTSKANLVVGADGIRSSVRKLLIGEKITPLNYLGCMVILGICSLKNLENVESFLLDSATVFQTVNGKERIYMMPYSSGSIMWQLSFPVSEQEAKDLNFKGAQTLKKEACERANWHNPIPQILAATKETEISGYPVYDRGLLRPELLEKEEKITLLGDAAHPMSPFKGQGANQALLDALALARGITKGCKPLSKWREIGIRKSVLAEFESEMLARSASKVQDSAEAVKLLHSEAVLHTGEKPRERCLKNKD